MDQIRAILSKITVPPAEPAATLTPTSPRTFQLSTVNCTFCRDIGFLGTKQPRNYPLEQVEFCTCAIGIRAKEAAIATDAKRRQQRLAQQFAQAGIPAHFQDFTLETLWERAAGDPEKQDGLSMAAALIEDGHADGKVGLYVYGPFGTGKTGLLTPVLRHYLERNKTALWIEFYDLVETVQASYSRNDSADPLDAARRCDVILLDDVGDALRNDRATGFAETTDRQRILYQIVNYRHNHVLPLLITSNLSLTQFAQQFGARTLERVMESCTVVQLGGRNLRNQH